MEEKCLEADCHKCVKTNLSDCLIVPFEDPPDNVRQLLSYFLYRAPNIASVQAKQIPSDKHAIVFQQMMENRHFKYQKFCNSNDHLNEEFEKGFIRGSSICLNCKRYVCQKYGKQKKPLETDLNCFLRHIRNAIAHGNVYYKHTGNRVFLVFDDYNTTYGKKNHSARIVCVKADLEHWRGVLNRNTPQ